MESIEMSMVALPIPSITHFTPCESEGERERGRSPIQCLNIFATASVGWNTFEKTLRLRDIVTRR